eukprot:TRINITY_DN14060_c0_g2_i1.p1 TRINITY_DN14060_c0_g2~~TRINITY_DN14060_c0_g2_i1.p1  ORF type:complete len:349 (-),score=44.53 TRINITY_DN14060_c0_g2_i1:15-1061(-)
MLHQSSPGSSRIGVISCITCLAIFIRAAIFAGSDQDNISSLVTSLRRLRKMPATNATLKRFASGVSCDRHAAFAGLCPWAAAVLGSIASDRWKKTSMARESVSSRPLSRSKLHVALISYSDRPQVNQLTRPSLERFVQRHVGRYHLFLESEPLLDVRDFHPAWNKLAYARRALIVGSYDAVVCVDDDILVTEHGRDPIYDAVSSVFFSRNAASSMRQEKLIIASLDQQVNPRVPLNTGLLILKGSPRTLELLDEVFRVGRRLKLVNGYTWLPRVSGLWDQDGFAEYIRIHGKRSFELLPHGVLQSFVRRGASYWSPGDFAAHFCGLIELQPHERAALLQDFIRALPAS